jgi:predicted lipoprotein
VTNALSDILDRGLGENHDRRLAHGVFHSKRIEQLLSCYFAIPQRGSSDGFNEVARNDEPDDPAFVDHRSALIEVLEIILEDLQTDSS